MRVAIVHDHLTQYGGAERVLEALQAIWPQAPTFTLLHNPKTLNGAFEHKDIRTSFLSRWPLAKRGFKWFLPFMPMATESYDLSDFDVVISNSSAFSKGIITPPETLHICYCHTPTRYLWSDSGSYVEDLRAPKPAKLILPLILHKLREWDQLAAQRVDHFIANSDTVAGRIKKYYRRDSTVIYPPVDIDHFQVADQLGDYFLSGGRLVAYKRFDIVIDAFTKLGKPLKIFGTGPEEKSLKKRAGSNIEFLGRISDEERMRVFAQAQAFIHPQEEDFGITPIESMAAGRPVIAYRKGGATETVTDGLSGLLFSEQSWEELADTVLRFKSEAFNPQLIRKQAEGFAASLFRQRLHTLVNQLWREHETKVLGNR